MTDEAAGPDTIDRARDQTIAAFLTDGSVIRLCENIGAIAGVVISLLDADGTRLVRRESVLDDEPWMRLPASPEVVASNLRSTIRLHGRPIGEFVAVESPREIGAARHDVSAVLRAGREAEEWSVLLQNLTGLLASIAEEFCEEADAMRNRIRELGALFRLNSLLVRASDSLDRLLNSALELALGALELDAGSIALFPEDGDGVPDIDSEAGVRTRASVGLSDEWLQNSLPLSKGREFDRIVLQKFSLAIADLRADGRVMAPERLEAERLRSFLSASLVHRGKPIGVMRLYGREPRVFSLADQRLIRSIAEQSAVAVAQARLLKVARRERENERQLTLASAVQRRMQPSQLPVIARLDVAAKSDPSSMVGGDIYDVFEREMNGGDRRPLGLVIGDVVGKGLPAALLMSAVRASLRAHANAPGELHDTIGRANRDMCRDTLPNEFTTLWYGSIDPETLELTYCSAGHEPPFIIRPVPGEAVTPDHVIPLKMGGLVIGVIPGERYSSERVQLRAGDVLVAYTDGLPDARNFQNEKWGMTSLVRAAVDAVNTLPNERASVVLDQILWSLRRFTGLRPQVDDETLIVVRVGV